MPNKIHKKSPLNDSSNNSRGELHSETIAAISTALGEGGIAILRISGPDAVKISQKILRNTQNFETPGLMRLTSLLDSENNILDRVLTVHFKAPKTYTGEDIVEIHTHGGILIARLCLQLLIKNGARIAEPGEFTRRAFLNGRIDLSEAEGVLGVIKSQSVESLKAAARTLTGGLSEIVKNIYQEILQLQGNFEIALDFPEGMDDSITSGINYETQSQIIKIKSQLEDLKSRCSAGILLLNGVRVVIAGLPNAGKSSLMNALLKKQRAIVTEIPGTTRDIIEENINLEGVPIRLTDTAGLRNSENKIELTGIELAKNAVKESDICLWVIDASREISHEDFEFMNFLNNVENLIIIFNKSDLPVKFEHEKITLNKKFTKIFLSAKTGEGLDALKNEILKIASVGTVLNSGLNASEKQLNYINECIELVNQALESINSGLGDDVTAELLGASRHCLMNMLGLEGFKNNEELLDSIFSRFCVGK